MKVLHILSGKEFGGIANVVFPLLRRLKETGCEPSVYLLHGGRMAEMASSYGIGCEVAGKNSLIDLGAVWRLAAHIKSGGFGLVHTHSVLGNFYGRLARGLSGGPALVTSVHADTYGELMDATGANLKGRLWFRVDSFMQRYSDLLVANSNAIRDALVARGVGAERIRVIHNGIDSCHCGPKDGDGPGARKRLGIPEGARLVGTVGRLMRTKNQKLLLRAAPAVISRVPGCRFLIVGDGNNRGFLEALAGELGISESVSFAGWQQDIYPFVSAMDVFVLPSQREGFGIAILEAMACSKPVVATTAGGIGEVVLDGETGLITDPLDPAALSEKIVRLLEDPGLAKSMGERGRRRFEEGFTLSKMAEETLSLYGEVIGGR